MQPQRNAELAGDTAQHPERRLAALDVLMAVEVGRCRSGESHELAELRRYLRRNCVAVTLVDHHVALDPG